MKLVEIVSCGGADRRDFQLRKLSAGLNVVSGPVSACREVAMGIAELLMGPPPNRAAAGCTALIESGGNQYRLHRGEQRENGVFGNGLVIADSVTGLVGHRSPEWLSRIDRFVWDRLFDASIDTRNPTNDPELIELLSGHFTMDLGLDRAGCPPFHPDMSGYRTWRISADARRERLEFLRNEIVLLRQRREEMAASLAQHELGWQQELAAIDARMEDCRTEAGALSAKLQNRREALHSLEAAIAHLENTLARQERRLPDAAGRPAAAVLEAWYGRLDDQDSQIRRWQALQNGIQQQRLQLKTQWTSANAISIESPDHPYHEAWRLLQAMEKRLDLTASPREERNPGGEPEPAPPAPGTLRHELRNDLGALCDELARQYRHVRHRAAVAELKQLRACYQDMEESLQQLVARRGETLEALRTIDPEGVALIDRADEAFVRCAAQDGYFHARQRRIGGVLPESATPAPASQELLAERDRLADMRTRRSALNEEIASLEREARNLETVHADLIRRRHEESPNRESGIRARKNDLDRALAALEMEIRELESRVNDDARWLDWKPAYVMTDASRYLAGLTRGRWTGLSVEAGQLVLASSAGTRQTESQLPVASADRALARLALRLAAIGQLALRGIRFPLLVTDLRQDQDNQALFETLDGFCRHGHQVFLFTSSASVVCSARQQGLAVFDLSDPAIASATRFADNGRSWRLSHTEEPVAARIYPLSTAGWPGSELGMVIGNVAASIPACQSENHKQGTTSRDACPTSPFHADGATVSTLSREEFPTVPVISASREPARHAWSSPVMRDIAIAAGPFPISLETELSSIDLVEPFYVEALALCGVRTVGHLVRLDAGAQDQEWFRRGFTPEQIGRWQSAAQLRLGVPDMSAACARALVSIGIRNIAMLEQSDPQLLMDRLGRLLEMNAGRRSVDLLSEHEIRRIPAWCERLRQNHASIPVRQPDRPIRTDGMELAPPSRWPGNEEPVHGNRAGYGCDRPAVYSNGHSAEPHSSAGASPRLFLQPMDPLEAAPSIGPKSASRFAEIGVATVRDFLAAEATDLAKRLGNRRMSANLIRTWQLQTELMCRVPGLRGHDAQLLVACGITSAERLADMSATDVLALVLPFSRTKEGERIIRHGKRPDLQEVSGWIASAAQFLRRAGSA